MWVMSNTFKKYVCSYCMQCDSFDVRNFVGNGCGHRAASSIQQFMRKDTSFSAQSVYGVQTQTFHINHSFHSFHSISSLLGTLPLSSRLISNGKGVAWVRSLGNQCMPKVTDGQWGEHVANGSLHDAQHDHQFNKMQPHMTPSTIINSIKWHLRWPPARSSIQ